LRPGGVRARAHDRRLRLLDQWCGGAARLGVDRDRPRVQRAAGPALPRLAAAPAPLPDRRGRRRRGREGPVMTPIEWSRPAGAEEVRAAFADRRAGDLPTHGGRTLSYVYDSGIAAADEIGREALTSFAATNGLDPTAFPSLAAMESDLVGLARDLLDAPASAV